MLQVCKKKTELKHAYAYLAKWYYIWTYPPLLSVSSAMYACMCITDPVCMCVCILADYGNAKGRANGLMILAVYVCMFVFPQVYAKNSSFKLTLIGLSKVLSKCLTKLT